MSLTNNEESILLEMGRHLLCKDNDNVHLFECKDVEKIKDSLYIITFSNENGDTIMTLWEYFRSLATRMEITNPVFKTINESIKYLYDNFKAN